MQQRSPVTCSICASAIHSIDRVAALALVEALLGAADEWASPLIGYRLSANFQADFKEEWGHWLHTAGRLGFQEALVKQVIKRAKRDTRSDGVDPNDKMNLVLAQELAPAMFAHYFCATGWTFGSWEPISGGDVDVDLQLSAPDGTPVMFQVKSPDQPGRVVNYRIVDGEFDDRVLKAVEKASTQLPKGGSEAKFIAVSANRRWPLSTNPQCLITYLIGSTLTLETGVTTLPKQYLGRFWAPEWRHVSGVVMLDYLRGVDDHGLDHFRYPCTVLLNPSANAPGSEGWFPHARVSVFDGSRFVWVRGAPGKFHTLPDGTRLTG